MYVSLTCYATLRQYQPEHGDRFKIQDGTTISDLLERLGIDSREVKLIFVNNKSASLSTRLTHGDTVGLFPAVGGG